jgi:mono/diheme cytochrome c family protein
VPVEFQPNRLMRVDYGLSSSDCDRLDEALTDLFGTPDDPRAPETTGFDVGRIQMAAGPAGYVEDVAGEKYLQRGLFRQHCAQCHGITGDGYGPAAAVMSPYPRDFRQSIFKFKSTFRDALPTEGDLRRVMVDGIPGTAMPSFRLLDEQQIDALVEYVKYLSLRGQVERMLVSSSGELDPETVNQIVGKVALQWIAADEAALTPESNSMPLKDRTPAEIAKSAKAGEQIFLSTSAKCTECHGKTGRGDGVTELDDWSRENYDFRRETAALAAQWSRQAEMSNNLGVPASTRLQRAAERLAAREQVVAMLLEPEFANPRDLQNGAFRGGSEPIDLFRRIHQGIPGTPMPAHGSPRPGVAGTLTEEEIWQVVDFLKSRS